MAEKMTLGQLVSEWRRRASMSCRLGDLAIVNNTCADELADAIDAHLAGMGEPPASQGEVILEHSGCGNGIQCNQLEVKLYPGDKVLMVRGRFGKAALAWQESQPNG